MRRAASLAVGAMLAWVAASPAMARVHAPFLDPAALWIPASAPIAPGERADAMELAYDRDGVLHLVAHLATSGNPSDLIHRSQAPGGTWSGGVNLAAGFALAGPSMELLPRPDGTLCLFFDGWRAGEDTFSAGAYLTCLRDGTWSAPEQIGASRGVTATYDGAFAPDGLPLTLYARPTRTIGFGEVELWREALDASWPRLAVDGRNVLHAAWAAFSEPFGIFTARSTDGGATWSSPESLTAPQRGAVPFDFVSDAVGNIHLLTPGDPALYRRWDGRAWSEIEEVPTGPGPKRLGVGPDGHAIVAWAIETGVSVVRRLPGAGWSAPEVLAVASSQPNHLAVAIDAGGGIAVAWSDLDGIGGSAAGAEGFAASVASPFDITLDPAIVAQSAALAAGVVLLVPLPAQLFNNTVEANYERISSAFARYRRRLSGGRTGLESFWRRPLGIVTFFVLAAVISAFLDPTLSLTVESAATVVGLLVGLVAVALGFALPAALFHRLRSGGRARIDVLPLALPIAVASVAISRLTGFEPGYLYGLLAGVTFLGTIRPGDGPRGVLLTFVWMIGVVIVAWLALVPVRDGATGPAGELPAIAIQAALATIVVAGLEALVFGLLPLAVAPGGVLFRTNRRAWAVLFGISAFAFFHILVNPTSGYLADTSRVPLVTTVALFILFSLVTGLTWAYFRFRPGSVVPPPSSA